MHSNNLYAIGTIQVKATARLRRMFAYIIDLTVIGITLLAMGLLLYALITLVQVIPELSNNTVSLEGNPIKQPADVIVGGLSIIFQILGKALVAVAIFLPVFVYIGIYLLPFVLTLPVTAPLIGLWNDPARFLLLRPFNRGHLTRPLKRIVRRDLSSFGHVYTLSDADIYIPWYIRIPLLLGQMALFSFRFRKIQSFNKLSALQKTINRTWLRNVNWCLARNKIFAIASADAIWQPVVRLLAEKVDAIIIDATDLRPHVLWEVNLCRTLGKSHQVIFLLSDKNRDDALSQLRISVPDLDEENQVFVFSYKGLDAPRRFKDKLAAIVSNRQIAAKNNLLSHRTDLLDIATTILFSLQVISLLGLAFNGFDILSRWTPWPNPSQWPGLEAVINTGVLTILVIGLVTLILLLLSARGRSTMYFLAIIQTVMLMVAPLGMLDW